MGGAWSPRGPMSDKLSRLRCASSQGSAVRTLTTSARKAAPEVGVHLLAGTLEDALCPPHDARRREALGKEGDKGLRGEAASKSEPSRCECALSLVIDPLTPDLRSGATSPLGPPGHVGCHGAL